MKPDVPGIWLVNPWIYDFAAFDFWARPLGLLGLGGLLRDQGYHVRLLDCLDRFHPQMAGGSKSGSFGRGAYAKTPVPKPVGLHDVARTYSRYGIPERLFRKMLEAEPPPEAILVTSLMTYWYPGVHAAIRIIREVLPDVPVFLGGIYATLCHDHAVSHAGADRVIPGQGETFLLEELSRLTGFSGNGTKEPEKSDTMPYPCLDLQSALPYVPILTGKGCPFQCRYCAATFLVPFFRRRSPDHVVDEICYWHKHFGVRDVAFYDDALLIDPENHILPILERIISLELPIRFHTPNAVHIRPLTREIATLMFRAGFKTIRMGLETAFFTERQTLDHKLGPREFEKAVAHLKKAGFTKDALGAYLLFGLPGQDMKELEASVAIVKACGVQPVLAQYSPIPHTALWKKSVASSRYDLESDPVFHNNSIFPCQKEPFSWATVSRLKKLTQ